ncbi:unnamed protein product [Closterium sp. Yama58-4]|nr:unnamed protein product [Closterium sp. Yama58-4]
MRGSRIWYISVLILLFESLLSSCFLTSLAAMRSKQPGAPALYIANSGRINSAGDDVTIVVGGSTAKPTGRKQPAVKNMVASCEESDVAGVEDDEEEWPEDGRYEDDEDTRDVEADIEEDEWWNRDYGGEEVEEWHAGDSEDENIAGEAKAASDATAEMDGAAEATDADANADAAAAASKEDSDEDPWSMDDVPLFRRRVKYHVDKGTKPRLTAAEKGNVPLGEGSSKGTRGKANVNKEGDRKNRRKGTRGKAKADEGCRKGDGGDGEAEPCSDEDYAEAAGPLPTYLEKRKPKDPHDKNPNARSPSPRGRGVKRTRRPWSVKEKVKWALRYGELESLKKTALEAGASVATIRRWVGQKESGVFKGAASSRKRMHGAERHSHHPDMEEALYRYICINRAKGVAVSVKDLQEWSHTLMKKHRPGTGWTASSHWSQRIRDRWNLVIRVKTKVGKKMSNGESSISLWPFY